MITVVWFPRCSKSRMIARLNENEVIVHLYFNAPWPVKDRDCVIRIKTVKDKSTGVITLFETSETQIHSRGRWCSAHSANTIGLETNSKKWRHRSAQRILHRPRWQYTRLDDQYTKCRNPHCYVWKFKGKIYCYKEVESNKPFFHPSVVTQKNYGYKYLWFYREWFEWQAC